MSDEQAATEQPAAPPQQELSADEKALIAAWLKEHWQGTTLCPISMDNNWLIGDHLVQPLTLMSGGVALGGTGYPVAQIICGSCGYTIYMNAVIMRVVPPKEPQTPATPLEPGSAD